MCPSYRATREEEHSTRGRANLLRAALSGKMPGGLASEELHESLALCLACKACKTECPAQVDMSKLKAEALHARVLRDGPILSDRLLGRMDATLRLSARLPGLAHFASRIPGMSSTIRRAVGLDARRPLPSPSVRTFSSQFRGLEARHGGRRVALFVDTFTEYFEPGVGHAAVRLLRHLGFEVELAKLGCCGRTRIARGLLTEARSMARENAANLDALARAGIPVLGLEPSCLLTMRDDYPDLLQEPPSPEAVRNLHVLDEYLLAESSIEPLDLEGKRCLVHPHCHQQALGSGGAAVALLESAGAEARGTEAGCCGMAGAFGYEHYELSRRIAEDRLVPAVESLGPDVSLVASGFSCRQQIRHMTGRTAVHPVALLSRHLR